MSKEKNLGPDNFGSRLQIYRKIKGLTGKELADIIGISQGSLSELENGKREPSGKVFSGIASNTNINIKWLLTGAEDAKQKERNPFFEELEEWAREMSGSDNIDWMKRQIEAQFPAFKKWKEAKEESERDENTFPSSKVA
jgi:transcriptional regulator with XRE-family HTH domain